jgi:hypothetical protein
MAKRGGKRVGAGRKSRVIEQNLNALLQACVPGSKRESIIRKLAEDAEHPSFRIRNEARKVLLAYMYGKPVERHEVEANVDVNIPSPEELKKKFAERRKSVEALDD